MIRLITFSHPNFGELRVTVSRYPLFLCKDVLAALGYSDTSFNKTVERIPNGYRQIATMPCNERPQHMLNTRGLAYLVMTSVKPNAKSFRAWLETCVLPQLGDEVAMAFDKMVQLIGNVAKAPEDKPERMEIKCAPGEPPCVPQPAAGKAQSKPRIKKLTVYIVEEEVEELPDIV